MSDLKDSQDLLDLKLDEQFNKALDQSLEQEKVWSAKIQKSQPANNVKEDSLSANAGESPADDLDEDSEFSAKTSESQSENFADEEESIEKTSDIPAEGFNEEELAAAHSLSEELNRLEEQIVDQVDFEDVEAAFVEGTELEDFESAEVEDLEFVEQERVVSIIESLLFATDRPQSLALLRQAFKGTTVKSKDIKRALEELMVEYAGGKRGITLEEVSGGYQLRTKVDNVEFLKRMVKGKTFKLSGPALEVLAITAYKQPCVKAQIDEIRGVESGHLLRGLMERGLVRFAGKSDLPGKPMFYETTKKFLEIFGLRNIKELPSLSEIDDLIPEGIGEVEEEKTTLDQITVQMAKEAGVTYSEGEEELAKISDQLENISTSSEFFEEEKRREKAKREADRAQMIQEALWIGEEVSERDKNWLERYEAQLAAEAEALAQVEVEIKVPTEALAEAEAVSAEAGVEAQTPFEGGVVVKAESSSHKDKRELTVAVEPDSESMILAEAQILNSKVEEPSAELTTQEEETELPEVLVSAFEENLDFKETEDFAQAKNVEIKAAATQAEPGAVKSLANEPTLTSTDSEKDSDLAAIDFEKMKKELEVFGEDPK